MFIGDINDFISTIIDSYSNIIITGDWNIHFNDSQNRDTDTMEDLISSSGLNQHVQFATHISNNIYDVVLSKQYQQLQGIECSRGPLLFDHYAVQSICKQLSRIWPAKPWLVGHWGE